jgi:hypothetical protein
VLYHGAVAANVRSVLGRVDVNQSRPDTDFGKGFYTTTLERQAWSWAWTLAQRVPGMAPAVIRFTVDRDRLAALDHLAFVRGHYEADEFWSFVFSCRGGSPHHGRKTNGGWYDVVVGPVTAFWQQRLSLGDADQISFHTDRAAALLDASDPQVVT